MRTYTVLRVTEASGIPLFDQHVRRLGENSRGALRHFASQAMPGMYRLWWDGRQFDTLKVEGSALKEGMPTRFAVSPFAAQKGRFTKPAPPSLYDSVRIDGVATLLTDVKGEELYESCRASLLAWDGTTLVLPDENVPAVASVTEAEVLAKFSFRRAVLPVKSEWPLLLLNAVLGTCGITVEGRAPFPADVRAKLDAVLTADS
ncbi:MAG: hypothetical protein JNM17_40000 [Archangium sp.]|nr:hypothetical protein [Archangium sp.]